ncbi:AT-hook motif nuclear-localized protein 26 isoform X2 [Cryptomeria japonica]|uniref:AT-hook motif nuclear-localized protein 26 isoform X2 n=1 Tax=Cryptomeria japonica TaxID=3369 RepID=UPI0025AB8B1E|nr:AT-hook motif nuclear-localized protein 26 isoform X2 [Cryptomeria japonica]
MAGMNGIQNQSSQDDEERRSCNSTEGHCLEEPRKRRGRPVGSKNKAKVPDIEGGDSVFTLELVKGDNVIHCLNELSNSKHVGISIFKVRGIVKNVKIQRCTEGGIPQPPMILEGSFELKKLSGSFVPSVWNFSPDTLSAILVGRQGEVRGDIVGDNLWAAGPLTVLITFKVLRPPQATVHNGNGIGEGIMLSSPPSSSAAAQCIRQPNQNNVFSSTRCPLPPPPPVHLGKGSSTPGPLPPLIPPQANVHNEFNGFPQASVHNEFNGFPQASVHNKYNGFASTPLQASVHMNEHNGFPSTNVHTEYPSCTPPPHHVPARMSNEYPPSAPPGSVPDFSNFSSDFQGVSTSVPWSNNPDNGGHYSVP